jgi:hypothetical protein
MKEPEPKFHPACLVLPKMSDAEFRELREDIRNQGQREPIIVDEAGLILDGRHRWLACQELFLEPKVETFSGDRGRESCAGHQRQYQAPASERWAARGVRSRAGDYAEGPPVIIGEG